MAGGSFIGGTAFSGTAGEVRYVAATGLPSGDVDGGGANWTVQLIGNPSLVAGDLIF